MLATRRMSMYPHLRLVQQLRQYYRDWKRRVKDDDSYFTDWLDESKKTIRPLESTYLEEEVHDESTRNGSAGRETTQ